MAGVKSKSGGLRNPPGGRPRNPPILEQKPPGQSPLDYMLAVMRDNNADVSRRDRMAIAAAPYVHGKPLDQPTGKHAERKEAALKASNKFDVPAAPPRTTVQ
jgi:hypothetical protein